LPINGVRRPKTIDAAATAGGSCTFGTRAAAGRTEIEATAAEIVVVVVAAALFLAGVDGDGLADVARGLEGQ
jgi:hypothetical protein